MTRSAAESSSDTAWGEDIGPVGPIGAEARGLADPAPMNAMLQNLVTLAALLVSPQEAPAQDPAAPRPFAAALPTSTLMVATIGEVEPHLDALRRTALFKLVEALPIPAEARADFAELVSRARAVTGLDEDQLLGLVRHGVSVALTEIDAKGQPHGLLSAHLADAQVYAAALERAAPRLGLTEIGAHGDSTLWTLRMPELHLAMCVHGDRLFVASHGQDLLDALARFDGNAGTALVDQPTFRQFKKATSGTAQPLLHCFARTDLLFGEMRKRMTSPQMEKAGQYVDALRLERIASVGYAVHVENGRFVDQVRVHFPLPREGLLGALLGSGTALSPADARLVPPGVTSFTIAHVKLQAVVREVLSLLDSADPTAAAAAKQGLSNIRQSTRVDLESDILRSLGEKLVILQWPGQATSIDVAVVVETTDAFRLQESLGRLLKAMRLPIRTRNWQGHEIREISGTATSPRFAVLKRHLVVALSEESMRSTLTQLGTPVPNSTAQEFLANTPEGATAASWTALGPIAESVLAQIRHSATPQPIVEVLEKALHGIAGDMETYVALDENGASLHTASPTGNLAAVAGVAIVASIALPNLIAARAAAESTPQVRPTADLTELVCVIAAAQRTRLEEDPEAQYGDLTELVTDSLLDGKHLGQLIGPGLYRHGDHLVAILLPETTAERATHFAVMAWPADGKQGSLIAATPDHELLINDVLASSEGIRMVQPTDIFLNGRFGSALSPGWRAAPTATVAVQPVTDSSADQEVMRAILAAEKAKPTTAPEAVLQALQSANPRVAARAAYALGQLRASEAVPRLCEMIESHPDSEVRHHAMAAASKMKDPRTLQTSLRALESDDLALRTLAAANLGALRSAESTNELLALVGRDQTGEPGDASTDRVAAVLALTDLGSHRSLVPASAAVTFEDPALGEALAYMFQTLSPKMEPKDESLALMAVLPHPCKLLRRYAIQRLGQLRDPATKSALEGRLGGEDDESLRTLVEVSLNAVRGTPSVAGGAGTLESVQEKAAELLSSAKTQWQKLDINQRAMVAAGGGGTLVLAGAFLFLRGRRRRKRSGEQWASMAAPSEGFGDHVAMDHDYGEAYDPEADHLDDQAWIGDDDDERYEEATTGGGRNAGRR